MLWTLRFPFRKRNPALIASQLTSSSSLAGGDGRIRAIIAIATTNVQASKTKAVLAPTVANNTPPTSGPTMLAKVPNPASSALDDGSSSGSSKRAGQVSSAGRLNV